METATLQVKGMTCAGCVASVKRVLQQVDGVTHVDVSLGEGRAMVDYDPDVADPKRFKAAIEKAGFEAG